MSRWQVKLFEFWRFKRVLLGVPDPTDPESAVPVGPDAPLHVRVVDGAVGGGSGPTQTVSLSRTTLALTPQAQALPDIPAGATGARIAVEGGTARIATVAPPPTAADGESWGDGSVWRVSGRADLLAFRGVIASGAPTLCVTYTHEVSA